MGWPSWWQTPDLEVGKVRLVFYTVSKSSPSATHFYQGESDKRQPFSSYQKLLTDRFPTARWRRRPPRLSAPSRLRCARNVQFAHRRGFPAFRARLERREPLPDDRRLRAARCSQEGSYAAGEENSRTCLQRPPMRPFKQHAARENYGDYCQRGGARSEEARGRSADCGEGGRDFCIRFRWLEVFVFQATLKAIRRHIYCGGTSANLIGIRLLYSDSILPV